jgi:hypothetical protein
VREICRYRLCFARGVAILARVLVADDDPTMLTAVSDALMDAGCDVARAGSGAGCAGGG